jgi:polygalacturonase
LKLGTESFGDIRNVTFSNCVVRDTGVGISFTCRDGGCYENILFNNIVLEGNLDFPVFVDITPRKMDSKLGHIRNITFQNMVIGGTGRFYAMGRPGHEISHLRLRDIAWNVTGYCEIQSVAKPPGTQPPREEGAQEWTLPLQRPYQFVLSHAEDVTMENIKVYDRTPEGGVHRGFLSARSISGLNVRNIKSLPVPDGIAPVEIENCQGVDVAGM